MIIIGQYDDVSTSNRTTSDLKALKYRGQLRCNSNLGVCSGNNAVGLITKPRVPSLDSPGDCFHSSVG